MFKMPKNKSPTHIFVKLNTIEDLTRMSCALEKIPFPFNSNGRQFDTEILIQFNLKGFNVKEIPVSFVEGARVGIMECVRYGQSAHGC